MVGERSLLSRSRLLTAVREIIAEKGLEGLRVRQIASAAGVSPASVLYHYPDQAAMMLAVHRDLVDDYVELRLRAATFGATMSARLISCVTSGFPPHVDEQTVGPLFEMHGLARRSAMHAELMTDLWHRERNIYETLITDGERSGEFTLHQAAVNVAEILLALEDGLALHLVSKNSVLTAEHVLRSFTDIATHELGAKSQLQEALDTHLLMRNGHDEAV